MTIEIGDLTVAMQSWSQTIYFVSLFMVLGLICFMGCVVCVCMGSFHISDCCCCNSCEGAEPENYMQFSQTSNFSAPV